MADLQSALFLLKKEDCICYFFFVSLNIFEKYFVINYWTKLIKLKNQVLLKALSSALGNQQYLTFIVPVSIDFKMHCQLDKPS